MTLDFRDVYLTATGKFLPGEPVDNDAIDRFIAPLGAYSARLKRRILADNGIRTRHYAIDEQGRTRWSSAQMAAEAVRACLAGAEASLADVSILCTGSAGGDLPVPGFANMVQGELGAGPMHTSSHQGVCASSMAALAHAASALSLSSLARQETARFDGASAHAHAHALVVASELPSRMFKHTRFAPHGHHADFDAHFLRWMLSDGAGACLLSRAPRSDGISLRLDWLHTRSFSGDHPVCMHIGQGERGESYLDYPSLAEAEQAGAFLLRQDIRLLPRLFELGIHEYVSLIRRERIVPREVDHFLCHYSSRKFAPVVDDLMQRAGFAIPEARWFSSLERRGNTGAAAILVMLDDFLRERTPKPGERILCFVPESGRFTVAFAQLTVVGPEAPPEPVIAPPHAPSRAAEDAPLGRTVAALAEVWHDYQSRLRRTPLFQKITRGQLTRADYLAFVQAWIPQVRRGTQWMQRAIENVRAPYLGLVPLIRAHADDEREDYLLLFDDYRRAGGTETEVDALRRNPGGEALDALMFRLAERENPVDLLGAIYIVEGTGQRVIPQLLPALKRQLDLPASCFRFLAYHGENDEAHLARWLRALELVLAQGDGEATRREIVRTARATADLYLLQVRYAVDGDV